MTYRSTLFVLVGDGRPDRRYLNARPLRDVEETWPDLAKHFKLDLDHNSWSWKGQEFQIGDYLAFALIEDERGMRGVFDIADPGQISHMILAAQYWHHPPSYSQFPSLVVSAPGRFHPHAAVQ